VWSLVWASVYATPSAQEPETIHVVQAGETVFGIAQQYGTTVDAIVALNGLVDADRIVVGQRLLISVADLRMPEYVVQPGDTLAMIARRHGVPSEELARLNRLANPSLIYVGQRLSMPPSVDDASSGAPADAADRSASPRPSDGPVYVVQSYDTLARIAARYEVSVWALAQANQIVNPSVIYVGQRLLIPVSGPGAGDGASSYLPRPFMTVEVVPAIAVQGQTVQVLVATDGEADLSGHYDGRPLFFAHSQLDKGTGQDPSVGESRTAYRALIAIPAMATPGPYVLELRAAQTGLEASLNNLLYVNAGSFGVQSIALPADKAHLLDPELVAQESQRLRQLTTQPTLPGLWQGRFAVPLAGAPGISAPFGGRRSYDGGPVVSYHAGVDYRAGPGTPVLCPASGKVVLAEGLLVRGNAVLVDHGRGVMSGYWHLAQISVVPGQRVEPGDLLGTVGNTGLSTGAHLHWEVRVMGVPVDPLQWVRDEIR
jgi:murein DD-endopeptidase MepM/ murein hydrolase activator NlpD